MKVIIVTGTPGTGKTTFSKKLAKEKKYGYIDVNEVIKKQGLAESYDRKRKTYVVDEKKLAKALEKLISEYKKENKKEKDRTKKQKGIVIDSHMSHYINPRFVDLCIVTRCSLKKLDKRLKKKGYSKSKIDENIECEIMDIILTEAKEAGHKVKVVES